MNTVVLEVRSLDDTLSDVMRLLEDGDAKSDARIAFATPELLWMVLTAERWQLVKALCDAGPVTVDQAAKWLRREPAQVRRDAQALLHAGVLNGDTRRHIHFPYDTVKVAFTLSAGAAPATKN